MSDNVYIARCSYKDVAELHVFRTYDSALATFEEWIALDDLTDEAAKLWPEEDAGVLRDWLLKGICSEPPFKGSGVIVRPVHE